MSHTIKDATVQRWHCDTHEQFEQYLADFAAACDFGRPLRTLRGLRPDEFI